LGGAPNTGNTWDWSPDAVEEELDRLIERRAKEADDANRFAQAWAESVRRYNVRAQAERRQAWIAFHRDLERLHKSLADEHRQKAAALLASEDEG
jgi:hypothetical protein